MKITLNRMEAAAFAGVRLHNARVNRDLQALRERIAALQAQHDQIAKEHDAHATEVLTAIGERAGTEIPLATPLQFEKTRDGGVLSWTPPAAKQNTTAPGATEGKKAGEGAPPSPAAGTPAPSSAAAPTSSGEPEAEPVPAAVPEPALQG